jgi:hypothetical protein
MSGRSIPRGAARSGSLRTILVLAVVLGSVVLVGPVPAGASQCAQPSLAVEPATAAPGAVVLVQGRSFAAGCEDHPLDAGSALRRAAQSEVELWVRVGEARQKVAEVHLDDRVSFVIAVQVPTDLGTGAGVIEAPVDDSFGGVVSVPLEIAGAAVEESDVATWTLTDGVDRGGVPWR